MNKRIVICAAGTGGHVMPGVAVARILASRGWEVFWIGTETGIERRLVEKEGIKFHGLDFQGLRGKGLKTMLFGGFKLLNCIRKSMKLLRELKPSVIFSTGGYIAVPVCLAGGCLGIPYVLMNSDADPLLSIRMIMGNASGIMCGFDGKAAKAAGEKGLVTGNPVRREIAGIALPEVRYAGREGPLNVLVFGGSLGAKALNDAVPEALARFAPENRPKIVHQSGAAHVDSVKQKYKEIGIEAEVVPFIDKMGEAYEKCDVVISRAGAISVSELLAGGIPAVMAPLVVKTTSHQLGNARYVEGAGAGICVPPDQLNANRIFEILSSFNREELQKMASKAKSLGKPHAAETVADFIEALAAHQQKDKK